MIFFTSKYFFRKVNYKSKRHKKSTKKNSKIFPPHFLILYKHIEPADTSKPKFFGVRVDFCKLKSKKRKSFSLLATLTLCAVMACVHACVHGTLQNLKLKPIG